MAKKKTTKVTKVTAASDIIHAYMEFVLEHDSPPKNMFSFAKQLDIAESEIYQLFGSFEAIEKRIFKAFFDNTTLLLQKDKDYVGYDAKNKLLSFYFTFFEVLKANRSYVVYALRKEKNKLKALSSLTELRTAFHDYIDAIGIETMDLKEMRLERFKEKSIKEGAWLQLLLTINFWLDDGSAGFEKTDVLIEKSITATFALLDTSTLTSVFDLGKFLFKERVGTR